MYHYINKCICNLHLFILMLLLLAFYEEGEKGLTSEKNTNTLNMPEKNYLCSLKVSILFSADSVALSRFIEQSPKIGL